MNWLIWFSSFFTLDQCWCVRAKFVHVCGGVSAGKVGRETSLSLHLLPSFLPSFSLLLTFSISSLHHLFFLCRLLFILHVFSFLPSSLHFSSSASSPPPPLLPAPPAFRPGWLLLGHYQWHPSCWWVTNLNVLAQLEIESALKNLLFESAQKKNQRMSKQSDCATDCNEW